MSHALGCQPLLLKACARAVLKELLTPDVYLTLLNVLKA